MPFYSLGHAVYNATHLNHGQGAGGHGQHFFVSCFKSDGVQIQNLCFLSIFFVFI